jgi:large subunit ribosomal protein L5
MAYTARLKEKYRTEVIPELQKQFNYDNIMQVPRLVKISVNKGVGGASQNKKLLEDAVNEIRAIN